MAAFLLAVFLLGVSGIPFNAAYCSMDKEPESCCCESGCCSPQNDDRSSSGDFSSEGAAVGSGLCCVVVTTETDSPLGEVILTAQSSNGNGGTMTGSSVVRAIDAYESQPGHTRPVPPEPMTPYALRTHLFTSSFLI